MDHVGIVTPLSDLTTVGGTFNGDTLIRINQPSRTCAWQDTGSTVFAVGVGNYYLEELKAVASDPICSHVLTLTSFDHIKSIVTEIQKSTCEGELELR